MNVLHKCDQPKCVNPDHLFLGTQFENVRDMETKGRARKLRGVDHLSAKLNETDIERIRDIHRGGGISQQAIAEHFGVNQTTISAIVRHEKWKHVAQLRQEM